MRTVRIRAAMTLVQDSSPWGPQHHAGGRSEAWGAAGGLCCTELKLQCLSAAFVHTHTQHQQLEISIISQNVKIPAPCSSQAQLSERDSPHSHELCLKALITLLRIQAQCSDVSYLVALSSFIVNLSFYSGSIFCWSVREQCEPT